MSSSICLLPPPAALPDRHIVGSSMIHVTRPLRAQGHDAELRGRTDSRGFSGRFGAKKNQATAELKEGGTFNGDRGRLALLLVDYSGL